MDDIRWEAWTLNPKPETLHQDPFDGDGMDDIRWEVWGGQLDCMDTFGMDGPAKREARERDKGGGYQNGGA
jgi:hypothetical protein